MLDNIYHERFCHIVASGSMPEEAYEIVYGRIDLGLARTLVYQPKIRQRLKELTIGDRKLRGHIFRLTTGKLRQEHARIRKSKTRRILSAYSEGRETDDSV